MVIALAIPGTTLPKSGPWYDKIVHLVLFAVFIGVWAACRQRMWLGVIIAVLLAPLSELTQHHWIPNRDGSWDDTIADWLGIILALGIRSFIQRRQSRIATD